MVLLLIWKAGLLVLCGLVDSVGVFIHFLSSLLFSPLSRLPSRCLHAERNAGMLSLAPISPYNESSCTPPSLEGR